MMNNNSKTSKDDRMDEIINLHTEDVHLDGNKSKFDKNARCKLEWKTLYQSRGRKSTVNTTLSFRFSRYCCMGKHLQKALGREKKMLGFH